MLQLHMFWQKRSFGEFKNSLSMQPAVIKAVINMLVLACVSGHMYHPEVWKRDELVTELKLCDRRQKQGGKCRRQDGIKKPN